MSIRVGRKKRFRPDMLPQPQPVYSYGKYPDRIRVSFADGRTKVYDTPVQQPLPRFFSETDLIRMSRTPGSYQYRKGGRK